MIARYTPPPFEFAPDDKRSYLLMVYTRTPFVPFALSDGKGGFRMYLFPESPGIYSLHLCKRNVSEVLHASKRNEPITDIMLQMLRPSVVYVGKTSGGGTLRKRISVHFRKISERQNISVDQIVCRYLQIKEDWNVLFAERHLIAAPEITDTPPPPWNTSGFGSNVPGGGRPGKREKGPKHFDILYPKKPDAPPEPEEEPDE